MRWRVRGCWRGDVKPVLAVFGEMKTEPAYTETRAAIGVMREQGYPPAANVLETLAHELNDARIIAWVSIPAAQRAPVDQYMLDRYLHKGQNRRALVNLALQMFFNPPSAEATGGKQIDPRAFYDLALFFGKDTGLIDMQLAQEVDLWRENGGGEIHAALPRHAKRYRFQPGAEGRLGRLAGQRPRRRAGRRGNGVRAAGENGGRWRGRGE